MLLKPTDEVLKALVLIGSAIRSSGSRVDGEGIVERLHRADADGVFDSGSALQMARNFCEDYC